MQHNWPQIVTLILLGVGYWEMIKLIARSLAGGYGKATDPDNVFLSLLISSALFALITGLLYAGGFWTVLQ